MDHRRSQANPGKTPSGFRPRAAASTGPGPLERVAENDDPDTRPRLSVVVIAYNEEDRIEACLESVIAACRTVGPFEIVLVDSNSTDRTVELAADYPITVLRITSDDLTTPGAGRYVGTLATSAGTILFVNGDMTLTESWLPRALDYLDANDDVAAVEGCLVPSERTEVSEVDALGSLVLCDADALAEVGGFDPYLRSNEAIDVGLQLKRAGYRLVRLPELSVRHHDDGTVAEPLRRWRRGHYFGSGQLLRKWRDTPSVLRHLLRRQRYEFAILLWLAVGVVSLTAAPLSVAWVLLSLVVFTTLALKLGFGGAASLLVAKSFGAVGLVVGLTQPTPTGETFPFSAVEVVSAGRKLNGTDRTEATGIDGDTTADP